VAIDPSNILLTDRVAVVTGGGAGIGRGIAAGMSAFGASVAIWERDADSCASAAESIGGLGIVTDVRDSGEVDAALERTAELGSVTILVNNAGGAFSSPILDTTENGWDALCKANLRHVLLCTQRVAQQLVAAGLAGSIITVTSIEGVRAAPGNAAYAAAKAGVINYTKTAAFELAPHGIRVNALAPYVTATEGLMRLGPDGLPPASGRPYRWAVRVISTRWPVQQYFWPPTWRATSPDRRSTSTAERTPPVGAIATHTPGSLG
jgi:3-oxoacyl-[acyl-carrier protein] reductase